MTQVVSNQAKPLSEKPIPSVGQKLLLLVFSLLFCLVAFVALDGAYSFLFRKSAVPTPSEIFGCLGRDQLRVLALQPYCSTTRAWGRERYAMNVNSQGFRDEQVRKVPLTDPRPRILLLGDSFTESMGPWNTSFVGTAGGKVSAIRNIEWGRGRVLALELLEHRAHRGEERPRFR